MTTRLTLEDLNSMMTEGVWGYLGNPNRTIMLDNYVLSCANNLGASYEDLQLVLSSKYGRWYLDKVIEVSEIEEIIETKIIYKEIITINTKELRTFSKMYTTALLDLKEELSEVA